MAGWIASGPNDKLVELAGRKRKHKVKMTFRKLIAALKRR